jgi:hypothetical protein
MKAIKSIFCLVFTIILISSPVVQAQYICQRAPNPTVINGSITAGDVQQAGRRARDGRPSNCGSIGSGALENNTALRRDSHNFTNPYNETVCVKVEIDFSRCGAQTQSAAYSTFNPANPALNVIGDSGYSTINKRHVFVPGRSEREFHDRRQRYFLLRRCNQIQNSPHLFSKSGVFAKKEFLCQKNRFSILFKRRHRVLKTGTK